MGRGRPSISWFYGSDDVTSGITGLNQVEGGEGLSFSICYLQSFLTFELGCITNPHVKAQCVKEVVKTLKRLSRSNMIQILHMPRDQMYGV